MRYSHPQDLTLPASTTSPCYGLLVIAFLFLAACTGQTSQTLITIADARLHPAQFVDSGESGDSPGDILVFDQPLLDDTMEEIGRNSGSCIRTRIAHSFQCQWTLTMADGSIQVAGREYDEGSSNLSIVGGSGKYSGITGEMRSTNNGDGTFTQVLRFSLVRQ